MEPYGSLWKTQEYSIGKLCKWTEKQSRIKYKRGKKCLCKWEAVCDRAVGRKLAANFFFLNVEETSNMLNHLFVGKSHLWVGQAFRRRRCDNVGSVAGTVNGRGQTRWNENWGRRARHCWAIEEVMKGVEWVRMVNTKWTIDWWGRYEVLKSQSEEGIRIRLGDFKGFFILLVVQPQRG